MPFVVADGQVDLIVGQQMEGRLRNLWEHFCKGRMEGNQLITHIVDAIHSLHPRATITVDLLLDFIRRFHPSQEELEWLTSDVNEVFPDEKRRVA